jgi:hypothetical protein
LQHQTRYAPSCSREFCVLDCRVLTNGIKGYVSILVVKMSGKRAGEDTSKDRAMIQRVIHEVGGGSRYPALTKINYYDWALLMNVKLKARAL